MPETETDPNLADDGSFQVQYQTNGVTWTTWLDWVNQVSANYNNAQNGTSYTFRVRAKDNAGNIGNWSDLVTTTVDTDSPQITSFSVLPPAFSPNGDGVQEEITATASISDASPVTWEAVILSGSSGPVITSTSGSGETVSWIWDGNGHQGDDDYTLVLTATDSVFAPTNTNTVVLLDTASPVIGTVYQPGTTIPWASVYTTSQTSLLVRGTREITDAGSGRSGVISVTVGHAGVSVGAELVEVMAGTQGLSATLGGLTPNALNVITITHQDAAGNLGTTTRQGYVDTS